MSLKETFATSWYPLDADELARNWSPDRDGTQHRQTAIADSLSSLARAINHLAQHQPRVTFCQAQPITQVATYGTTGLYQWRYPDIVQNATSRTARIVAIPTQATTSDCYVGWDAVTSSKYNAMATAPTLEDKFAVTLNKTSRTFNDALTTDSVDTYNGFTIADIVVQDNAITIVDTTTHVYVQPSPARPGSPIIAGTGVDGLEALRSVFHEVRSTNMKIDLQWAAQKGSSGWVMSSASNEHGIVATATTYGNVFDPTISARSEHSPGVPCWSYRSGVGHETKGGVSVHMTCGVLAQMSGSDGGVVKFIGPDHVASNEAEINITGGGTAPAWYFASAPVHMNTAATDQDVTTARNKVDIHARSTSAASQLHIYGIVGYLDY